MNYFVILMTLLFSNIALANSGEKEIYIFMEANQGGEYFYVDSTFVNSKDLLNQLNKKIKEYGNDSTVNVVFSENLTYRNVFNMRGLLFKAGFSKIKYFSFNREVGKMAEITFGKVTQAPSMQLLKPEESISAPAEHGGAK